ncbi:hypothetical protein SKAU_G00387780 [Synaphobranchus kaupii]|uniref:Uncharacterized protein n=1 Tax=Synaphobranchus kaupii TaxID=118154 RepID=A0A9Q1EAZ7_SYNKA|nr:hypothetical protein SKAU_G00387780 [Synaphobranchus kaupii]
MGAPARSDNGGEGEVTAGRARGLEGKAPGPCGISPARLAPPWLFKLWGGETRGAFTPRFGVISPGSRREKQA